MKAVTLPAAAVALLSLVGPALADPVLTFKFAHDAVTPEAPLPDEQRVQPPVPYRATDGLPGFYDPSSNSFTPLALPQSAAAKTYVGTVTVAIHIHAASGVGPDDTVFCRLTILFGNVAGDPPQFFQNHYESPASINFAAGEPSVDLSREFRYTPNSPNAKIRLQVECNIPFASDGAYHSETILNAVQPAQGGDVTASFQMDL